MAGNLEDVLIRIRGDSSDVVRSIEQVRQEVRRIPESTTAEIRVKTEEAREKVDQLLDRFRSIDRSQYNAKVDAEVGRSIQKVEGLRKVLDRVTKDPRIVDINIQRQKVDADISAVMARIDDLRARKPEIIVQARVADAQARIEVLRNRLEKLEKKPWSAEVQVKSERIMTQIDLLDAQIEEMVSRDPTVQVSADISRAEARLAELSARADLLDRKKVDVEVQTRTDRLSALDAIQNTIQGLEGSLRRAETAGQTFGQTMAAAFSRIKGLGPFLGGLAIILVSSLLPGLIAVGSAALSAASGIGALATALVGALGPAAALGGAIGSRLNKILDVRRSAEAAKTAAVRAGIGADEAAAAAEQKRISTQRTLADGARAVERAERAVGEATEQAAQAIEDANERVTQAQRDVADAARQVSLTTIDAYDAMADAAERVRDSILDIQSAQLGLESAEIGVKEANLELRQFREELGLAGDEFDGLFKKFEDVDVDLSGLRGALAGAGAGGGVDQESLIKLQRLLHNVRVANHAVKESHDEVSDAETNAARARRENNRYLEEGIAAYGPLRSAIESQSAAQESLSEATAEYNRLLEDGIGNAPAVVAANEALADANRNLARARQDAANAPDAVGTAAVAAAVAAEEFKRLTREEQRFYLALDAVGRLLTRSFRPATDAVFAALFDALIRLPGLVEKLRSNFSRLGGAVADSLGVAATALASPDVIAGFRGLIDGATELTRIIGPLFSDMLRLFLSISRTAMPELVSMMGSLAGEIERLSLAAQSGDLGKFFAVSFDSVRAFGEGLGAVLSLFRSLVETVAPFGNEFVRWMAKGVKSFAKWMRSAEGQERIKRFFEATLPAIQSVVKFVIAFGRFLLVAFEASAPFIEGFIDGLTSILDFLSDVLGLIARVINSPLVRWAAKLLGSFLAFGFAGKVLKGIGWLLRLIGKAFKPLVNLASRFGAFFGRAATAARSALGRVVTAAGNLVGRVVAALRSRLGALGRAGAWIITTIWNGARAVFAKLVTLGKTIWDKVWAGLKSVGTAILDAAKWVITKLGEGVKKYGGALFQVGKALLSGLIDGFTKIGREAFEAIKGLADKIVKAVKDVLGIQSPSKVMMKLGQHMLAGLIKGFTSGDVVAFVKKHLGGLAGLAKDLALGAVPGGLLVKGAAELVGLASGGIVRGPVMAAIGEGAHREAVLPLSRAVLSQLGRAIAAAMPNVAMPRMPGAVVAAAAPSGGGIHIDRVEVSAPGGEVPDARAAAVALARELERRGGR